MANSGRKPGRPRKNPGEISQPAGGENTSAYFRRILNETPTLLDSGSNKETLGRWLADHPGQKIVPNNVRANLANIKSVMRKQGRTRGKRQEAARAAQPNAGSPPPIRKAGQKLELLEEHIDDALTLAKNIDREGL